MASLRPIEIAHSSQVSGARKHGESLRRKPVSAGMDAVIRRLINTPQISRGTLLELFEHRASFAAITAWRFGWRGPPQWAVDLIGDKLATRAARDAAEFAKIRPTIGMGWNKGAATLAAWREKKSRQKEAALQHLKENES